MEDISILTAFLSTWFWQILAIQFLCFSFLFFALPRSLVTQVFYISFFLIFIFCEYKSLIRRKKLEGEKNE